jgi:hypothetical protein
MSRDAATAPFIVPNADQPVGCCELFVDGLTTTFERTMGLCRRLVRALTTL